jgi:hypothetical protein
MRITLSGGSVASTYNQGTAPIATGGRDHGSRSNLVTGNQNPRQAPREVNRTSLQLRVKPRIESPVT